MSYTPKMNLPDNMGNVGDVIGDCTECGKHRWGPTSKKGAKFVCNNCVGCVLDGGFCQACNRISSGLTATNWNGGKVLEVCKECFDNNDNRNAPKPLSPHYAKLAIDPYEYAHRNGLGMLQGNVVKYVTRYKDKNGKEDLEKAMNTLQRLIDMEYPK